MIRFADTKGEAVKLNVDYYKFTEGENKVRIVGGILPRYVYWKATPTGKNLSVECLSFDRNQEKFTNTEKDWFRHYFPEDKCSWSYLVNCIDLSDGKVKVLGLKKKLFKQIIEVANDLGDPTDIEKGFDLSIKKEKTGPNPFNVEYTLNALRCKVRSLTPSERDAAASAKTIDELFPRPTPESQKEFIERNYINVSDGPEVGSEENSEIANEFADEDLH